VIRDILHRLRDRFPRKVLIWPVAVQGASCAPDVARAIAGFNALTPGGALPRPDLLIVARGGGSIEDLWGFNEEIVVRAAAASQIPLISAVGHETDTTLIDFAADRRAPTPTAAAEMAVPVRRDLLAWTAEQEARLTAALTQGLSRRGQRLADLARALPRPATLLDTPRQRLDRAGERLPLALTARVRQGEVRLQKAAGGLRPGLVRARTQRLGDRIDGLGQRLGAALARPAGEKRRAFEKLAARLDASRLAAARDRKARDLDALVRRLVLAGETRTARDRSRLAALDRTHQTLGYRETLKRGYAVVRGDGEVVMTRAAAEQAAALEIEFSDGRLALDETARPAAKKAKPKPPSPEQGSLF